MAGFMNVLTVVAATVWGAVIGAAAGLWIPFVIAKLLAVITKDNSDSGLGFFVILTIPALALLGGKFGFSTAGNLRASGDVWAYFARGEGLWFAAPYFVLGSIAAVGLVYSIWGK